MNPKEDQLSEESTSAKIKWRWSFLLILAILALNILSCQNLLCFLYYCSNEIGDYSANGLDFSASGALVDESKMTVWYAIKASGVFTPTNGSEPGEYVMDGVDHDIPANWEAMFHEVEEKGFMAIRVPHVPPTYTLSSIYSTTVEIQYYSPPTATTATVVTPTLNRRVDLEPMV
ncbi:MAG: hypothetical protein KKD28_09205, partial [Chloroflexi bacterium]|nr:hypothetical protein [Chloroflexota bacterium]